MGTSQGVPAATRNWKRQRTDPLLKPLEEVQSTETLILASDTDFRLRASRIVRGQISIALNLRVCGNLIQQLQETDTRPPQASAS